MMRVLMNGAHRADATITTQRKRSRTMAASSGVLRKKVMMSRIPNFFRHSQASQKRSVGLYPYETMLKLYFGLFENRWIIAPRQRGNPTPQIASDAAATALATWAMSESQSRWGAKLNMVLPSASVLQEKTPNADFMIAGYTN